MPDTTNTKSDLEILTQLNADFLASVQNGDVRRFEQILAEDFMASLPDFLLRDKKQFLDMMAAPRPFTELKADEVKIRLLGDFAIIHAHMTLRTADGVQRQGRYTMRRRCSAPASRPSMRSATAGQCRVTSSRCWVSAASAISECSSQTSSAFAPWRSPAAPIRRRCRATWVRTTSSTARPRTSRRGSTALAVRGRCWRR